MQSSDKLKELKIEYKNALEIYQLYYEKDTLKDKYYDRTDNALIKYFKKGPNVRPKNRYPGIGKYLT